MIAILGAHFFGILVGNKRGMKKYVDDVEV